MYRLYRIQFGKTQMLEFKSCGTIIHESLSCIHSYPRLHCLGFIIFLHRAQQAIQQIHLVSKIS